MREGNRLTALKVARLKTPGRYCDGLGLWLQVSEWHTKAWLFRYKRHGKPHQMGLGPLHTVSLQEARARARQARQLLIDGLDPIAVKHQARTVARLEEARATTFNQCAEDYINAHSAGWKNSKHREQWRATLETYAAPIIGDLPIGEIDTALVLKVLRPIWQEKPETASRVRGRIERVLSYWAATQKISRDNPARWRGHLDALLPAKTKVRAVKHHPALPFSELPGFMAELRERESLSARALEFTILTATRTGEAIAACWDEFDLAAKVWIVPAERMKGKRAPHRVPLSDRAIELLASLPRDDCRLWALSNFAMLELLRGMRPGYVPHGFRSTFSDWARDRTAYPRDVIEMALAHSIKDKSEAAYRRGDALEKRRRLMADWARYCEARTVTADVVALHG
jgi:integrase